MLVYSSRVTLCTLGNFTHMKISLAFHKPFPTFSLSNIYQVQKIDTYRCKMQAVGWYIAVFYSALVINRLIVD